jgi:7-carboxy-7-deazaguanine synthase
VANLALLTRRDEVKFVILDRTDYEFARDVIRDHHLPEACGAVLLSPVHGDPALPARIAEWMLRDRLPARLQLQLHKFVWPPEERGR